MDRTQDLLDAAERFLARASLPPENEKTIRSAMMLRPTKQPSPFTTSALCVAEDIRSLVAAIREMQRHNLTPGADASEAQKDAYEAEVGANIKLIAGRIDRLKEAIEAAQRRRPAAGAAAMNEATAAHCHGMVLILAERLGRASQVFDKTRAARYKLLLPKAARPLQAGKPWSKVGGGSSWLVQPERGSSGGSTPTSAAARRQQVVLEQENRALLERLNQTASSALSIERTMAEVAALNQMFATAVLAQAETIETIYLDALDATQHIKLGNEALTKTVAINRSTTRYIFVLLLVATLGLLFLDWFNS